jgi:hypothetical protein
MLARFPQGASFATVGLSFFAQMRFIPYAGNAPFFHFGIMTDMDFRELSFHPYTDSQYQKGNGYQQGNNNKE